MLQTRSNRNSQSKAALEENAGEHDEIFRSRDKMPYLNLNLKSEELSNLLYSQNGDKPLPNSQSVAQEHFLSKKRPSQPLLAENK